MQTDSNENLYPLHNHIRITPAAWFNDPNRIDHVQWEVFRGRECIVTDTEKTEEAALTMARAAAIENGLSDVPVKHCAPATFLGRF